MRVIHHHPPQSQQCLPLPAYPPPAYFPPTHPLYQRQFMPYPPFYPHHPSAALYGYGHVPPYYPNPGYGSYNPARSFTQANDTSVVIESKSQSITSNGSFLQRAEQIKIRKPDTD